MMRKKLIGSEPARLFGSRPKSELLAFSFSCSEGGFDLPLILVDRLYDLEDRQWAVASFAKALAGRQISRPLEGRAYRLDHGELDALVFHDGQQIRRTTVALGQTNPLHFTEVGIRAGTTLET
jgi:hypothetical protein